MIPYNLELVEKAREYRKKPTHAERYLWEKLLRKNQLLGYKFTRQKPLLQFIVDFYCSKLLMAIEIDGEYHNYQIARDEERTNILNSYNIQVVRFTNVAVLNHFPEIEKDLANIIKVREIELSNPSIPLETMMLKKI